MNYPFKQRPTGGFLRALPTESKELKHMRLHGKIVGLLDLSLKSVEIVVGNLDALDIPARGADEVVVMVVRMKQLVALHPIKDIDLGEDLVVREKVELSVNRRLIHGGVFLRNLLKKLRSGDRLACRDERLDHRLSNLGDAKAFGSERVDELLC